MLALQVLNKSPQNLPALLRNCADLGRQRKEGRDVETGGIAAEKTVRVDGAGVMNWVNTVICQLA
jgi:hypothetical protein